MKVECLKENLVDNIYIVERAVGKNLNLPVLGCILIEAKGLSLKLKATNLDLGVEVNIPAKIIEDGTMAVSGSVFYNVINSIYNGVSIKLLSKNENLSITSHTSSTLITSLPHEDFPLLPKVKSNNSFTIDIKDFLNGLNSVWFSSSHLSIKPELASVYISIQNKKITFTATDSFRLSEKVIINKNVPNFNPLIIPIKNIPEIIKALEHSNIGEVIVTFTKNQISFSSDNIYITSRLIDGIYPDYHQIIPKKVTTKIITLKQDLINSLKKINIFSDKFNHVCFHISSKQRKCTLTSSNQDVGETTEQLQAAVEGEDLDINFNHRYITDALQIIPSDSVSLSFSGLGKPMVMEGVSDQSYLYLVMPMNK